MILKWVETEPDIGEMAVTRKQYPATMPIRTKSRRRADISPPRLEGDRKPSTCNGRCSMAGLRGLEGLGIRAGLQLGTANAIVTSVMPRT